METNNNNIAALFSWLHQFLTPPPVSPLFQEPDGVLADFNEDLVFIGTSIFLLFLLDIAIAKRYFETKERYFFLHAVTNAVVVVASMPDLMRSLFVHPYDAFTGPVYTVFGNAAVCALHLYHCIAFPVTSEDVWHHVLFVGGIGGFAFPFKNIVGTSVALCNFFLSGLPGGIEYVLLILVKKGVIEKRTEKTTFAWLNTWVRAPGALWTCCIGYLAFREGRLAPMPGPLFAFFALLVYYNGVHYNQIAIESCARFEWKLAARADEQQKSVGVDHSSASD